MLPVPLIDEVPAIVVIVEGDGKLIDFLKQDANAHSSFDETMERMRSLAKLAE